MIYFRELRCAIKRSHGCEAVRMKTVPVREVCQGEVIWDGAVEVFDLIGHAKAKRCYAWGYPSEKLGDKLEVVTVLEIGPVVSPESAVRAAIANRTARVADRPAAALWTGSAPWPAWV
jgi:hypothetical protein